MLFPETFFLGAKLTTLGLRSLPVFGFCFRHTQGSHASLCHENMFSVGSRQRIIALNRNFALAVTLCLNRGIRWGSNKAIQDCVAGSAFWVKHGGNGEEVGTQ